MDPLSNIFDAGPMDWAEDVLGDFDFDFDFDFNFNLPTHPSDQNGIIPSQDVLPDTRTSSVPPKIGKRFSMDSLSILRNWLAAHQRNPFPDEEDKRMLERTTGLNRTQILNWLANARRRGKGNGSRDLLPTAAVAIAERPGTPSPWDLNPLQRWERSPPEDEPASRDAIARAMGSRRSSGGTSTAASSSYKASPTSSTGTSRSGSQVFSGDSNGSGSLDMRRKRRKKPRSRQKTLLTQPPSTFQCTFCTDTFTTKHVWQRHEKSLHVPLERWVCGPHGYSPGVGTCAFCDEASPDEAHLQGHGLEFCDGKDIEDRTFFRKDHLAQHLRLVHSLTPEAIRRRLEEWKTQDSDVKSRCGFCSIRMETWQARVDHLAEHFKMGRTMADWHGDWGFEQRVLARLDHAMHPYIINAERKLPCPFIASSAPYESPRDAYELLRLELAAFVDGVFDRENRLSTSPEIQLDAARIIFTAEISSAHLDTMFRSWLRDLIMSNDEVICHAKLRPFRTSDEGKLTSLVVMGRDTPFDHCEMEAELARNFTGRVPEMWEVQSAVLEMIRLREERLDIPGVWLMGLVKATTGWLTSFFERNDLGNAIGVDQGDAFDAVIASFNAAAAPLVTYILLLRQQGLEPSDAELRSELHRLRNPRPSYDATPAIEHAFLTRFKRKHIPWGSVYSSTVDDGIGGQSYFLNDINCDKSVARELTRWVAATMSPYNPNKRVPTDEELRHQARWILYEDGDPFNQTIADSSEWLNGFKRDIGIMVDGLE